MAVAVAAAEQLGHHQVDVSALGDGVGRGRGGVLVMRSVVRRAEHTPHGDGLLADVGVDDAGYVALVKLLDGPSRAKSLY